MNSTIVKESEQGFDRIDPEAGIIYGVKVLGLVSKNGRRYQEDAVRKAAPLYEGAVVNIDHENQQAEFYKDRPIADRWGVLRDVVFKEGALYADLHYIKAHPMTPQLIEAAERFADTFGLSHDASGDERMIDGERQVVEIYRVNSVDVVSRPATNAGLFESVSASQTQATSNQQNNKVKNMGTLSYSESIESGKKLNELLEAGPMYPQKEIPKFDESYGENSGQVGAAFRAAMIRVLDDASMESAAKLQKLKAIMAAKDKAMQAMSDAGIGDEGAEGALAGDAEMPSGESPSMMGDEIDEESMTYENEMSPEDAMEDEMEKKAGEMEESCKCKNCQKESHIIAENAILRNKLDAMQCRAMLVESGCEASEIRINALMAIRESDRSALVATWKPQKFSMQKRPERSPSVLNESASGAYPKNQSEFFRVLR
jgi:hypothetical protein